MSLRVRLVRISLTFQVIVRFYTCIILNKFENFKHKKYNGKNTQCLTPLKSCKGVGTPFEPPLKRYIFCVFAKMGKTQHCSSEQVEPLFFPLCYSSRTHTRILPKSAENIAETSRFSFFSALFGCIGVLKVRERNSTPQNIYAHKHTE